MSFLNYQETARNGRSAFKSPDYARSSKGAAGALKALILLDRTDTQNRAAVF